MERLTHKIVYDNEHCQYVFDYNQDSEVGTKLGEFEDVLEKYGIESVEKLEDYLTHKLFCYAKLLENLKDIQHKLEVAEMALNEMSNYAINDNDLYDLVSDFNIEKERYDEDHFGIDTCDVVDYFKEKAESELKGE